ncbi:SIAE [Mytilus edulis]|uniref:SIAE n=1 Tax=Mytilus edulis TaxID=6550 RepID=A0A8S3SD08_MYTED|nr:SIAE [Mytilus edulis]
MVLQRGPRGASVWGHSPKHGDKIDLYLDDQHSGSMTVNSHGIWQGVVHNPGGNHGYILTASSSLGNITLKDVWFGDVWLCSGQSNMHFLVGDLANATEEISDTSRHQDIRLFKAKEHLSTTPLTEFTRTNLRERWLLPKAATVKYFSAVCWLFGKYLSSHVSYPIGLIESDWGGTPIEAWSSPDALQKCTSTQQHLSPCLTSCVGSDHTLSTGEAILFNGVQTQVGIDNLSTFTSTGSCGICRKLVKRNDKAIQCDECDLWIHTRCTSVDNTTYTKLQNTNDQWFCQNCVAPCGICSGNIHNCDPAIECDRCKTWIHNSCAIVSNDEYKNIQATNCTWICPLCDETNLSTSYSSTSSGIEINNIFDTLRNNKETHTCSRHMYTSKITMVSININGLRGKKLELQAYLQTENPDIVALQETKINNSIATNELIPDTLGYDIYRNDRTGNGGGTMLLVKTHLDSAPVKILENGSESIWSKIVLQGKQHYIGSWYRPPDAPLDQIQLLKDQMDKIKKLGKANKQPCIHILGDFNYRKINWRTKLNKDTNTCLNGSDGQALIDILNEASAEQLILFPTRESNTLDLLITTLPGQFTDIHSPDRLSDHDIVMGTLRCTLPRKIRPERTSYQYSKGNYNQMRDDSRDFTRDKYFNGHQNNRNVEENWIMIKEFILGTTKINVPTKILKGKQSIPWINKNIKTMIKRKNRTHANYKRNNSMRIKRKWQELRRNINKEIELAHNNYVNNLIGDIKQDSKPFWKYINNQKADKQGIPPLKTHDNKTADTDQQKS